MCQYQITPPLSLGKSSGIPICEYTKEFCTFCVYGNADTYLKAKKAESDPLGIIKEKDNG